MRPQSGTGNDQKQRSSSLTVGAQLSDGYLLNINATKHIKIQYHIVTFASNAFYLTLKSAIITPLIHFMILGKLIVLDTLPEIFKG